MGVHAHASARESSELGASDEHRTVHEAAQAALHEAEIQGDHDLGPASYPA